MVYMMYDVQPAEGNWRIKAPFAGERVETELGTVLMARGATNQKGPQRAFLNALDAILKVEGALPVNLLVVAEGEEEPGSTHFDQVLAPYLDRHGVQDVRIVQIEGRGYPAAAVSIDDPLVQAAIGVFNR